MQFIMDTGCGHDLISKSRAKKLNLDVDNEGEPMFFYTANGSLPQQGPQRLSSRSFGPFLLDETPSVLSVGKKCKQEGFTLYGQPLGGHFCSPKNKRIDLVIYVALTKTKNA